VESNRTGDSDQQPSDPQSAGASSARVGQLLLCGIELAGDEPPAGHDDLAGSRQRDATRMALEKRLTGLSLKSCDLLGDRRGV